MAGLAPVMIVTRKGYGLKDFKGDLQAALSKAGVNGQGVGFLLTDKQIVEERFLASHIILVLV